MEPTRLLPIIVLFSLVTVEYGGWALLGFLTGRGALGLLPRAVLPGRPRPRRGAAGAVAGLLPLPGTGRLLRGHAVAGRPGLLVGVLAQSGGFFVHLGVGRSQPELAGTVLTRSGALLIAAALVILAVGLI